MSTYYTKCCDYKCRCRLNSTTINLTVYPSDLFVNNTLFVDEQYGSDLTGVREYMSKPFEIVSFAIIFRYSDE